MFLPEKDLQYGKLGDVVPYTTWSKMGDGLLDGNGEETETEVSIPHKGENKVNCEYALEDVSRGGYYGSGSKITRPGTYRRVLRDFTLKMNSISHYRLSFGGVDGGLVTKFYINDKEWQIDPRTASLDSIDPVTGSLRVTLYDLDYITLAGAGEVRAVLLIAADHTAAEAVPRAADPIVEADPAGAAAPEEEALLRSLAEILPDRYWVQTVLFPMGNG